MIFSPQLKWTGSRGKINPTHMRDRDSAPLKGTIALRLQVPLA